MTRGWARVRAVWQALRHRGRLDAAMHDEMRFHIEMEAERLMREHGLEAAEARRRAHVAFGGVEKYKAAGRDVRGLRWLDVLWLDVRFGIRMLIKHRGLTLAGGFAMAVAIAFGASVFEILTETLNPALPFEDGGRVVALQLETATPGTAERRVLHDFAHWRSALTTVEQLGAYRTAQHNLMSADTTPEPITVAEMTASGFQVARTPPLAGRYLLPADEREDAAPVVVIGHQAWRSRFGGDQYIVGRMINLGGTPTAIVGVMPAGFRFPIDHEYWMPFRANPLRYARRQGPEIHIFGRLGPGVTLAAAQAELTIAGQPAGAEPETEGRLRPLVLPFTYEPLGISSPARRWMLRIALLLVGALTFVVAINLAILFYARTVTRLGEIAVRTALGASRRRILAQLFVEALALSVIGAGAGLGLAQVALSRLHAMVVANGALPFWITFDLSAATALYALGLAVLAAAVMGVLPGLKATGRRMTVNLHEGNGRAGTRLGPLWTALVVAQVAVAVAVLPAAVYLAWQVARKEIAGPGFAADRLVVGTLALGDDDASQDADRIRRLQIELTTRLEAEAGISTVTFSSGVPGFAPGRRIQFEDGITVDDADALEVSTLEVAPGLFDAYGARLLAGRSFAEADAGAAHVVIVNRTFAQTFLGQRSPLGVRFRYARARTQPNAQLEAWHQIIGVVDDFPRFPPAPGADGEPTVYHPATAGDIHPVVLSVRFAGNIPDGFIPRFRKITAAVDPALQLRRVVPLTQFYDEVRSAWRYLAWGLALMTMSVLLLSAAGIYAMMSFTVARRTREIGIRSALGANPRRLLLGIFGRSSGQLALGVAVGSLLSGAVFFNLDLGAGRAAMLLLIVAALMLIVGLLAAIGPARRGLCIQAIEALRIDG